MSWSGSWNTRADEVQQKVGIWIEQHAKNQHGAPEQVRTAVAALATQLAARDGAQRVTLETSGHLDATSGSFEIKGRIWYESPA